MPLRVGLVRDEREGFRPATALQVLASGAVRLGRAGDFVSAFVLARGLAASV